RAGAAFAGGTPGHVYVRASINDARDGWWHFDSGADSSVIDESVAQEFGMEVIGTHRSMGADGVPREGTWRRARSVTVGRIRIENAIFRALDLSANNAPPGERRMGTFGYDLFARVVVEYGDGGRFVRICDPATYRLPRGGRWQKLQHIDSTPAFPGSVEGRLGLFQLDTGTVGSIDFTQHFHQRAGLLRNRATRRMNVAGSGGSFPVEVGRVSDFRLAGQVFEDLEVAFRTGGISREGSAGTVGREVLDRFTMVFDYPHQRLAFLPAGSSGSCG
ncbi:retropepsin-like aspartic protease, partial [Allosphingosinicella sp.]|uniref:retropepsin-like aspartic protease n=1 Tax=Allosphingosinicella sp. TaxID=2823234 RepID=UPI002EE0FB2B